MYYPSVARATPPRDPHVQLDEDSTLLIPQELVKRGSRDQQHDDGGVVCMVEIRQGFAKRCRGERRWRREAATWREGGAARAPMG
jgi:hypothetical protein